MPAGLEAKAPGELHQGVNQKYTAHGIPPETPSRFPGAGQNQAHFIEPLAQLAVLIEPCGSRSGIQGRQSGPRQFL